MYCAVLDGYCSTVQEGLLDWFEVDLGFTELRLLFIQNDVCVLCVFVLYSPVSLSSRPCLDILHCFPRAVGVPVESALNVDSVCVRYPHVLCSVDEDNTYDRVSMIESALNVDSVCQYTHMYCAQ